MMEYVRVWDNMLFLQVNYRQNKVGFTAVCLQNVVLVIMMIL